METWLDLDRQMPLGTQFSPSLDSAVLCGSFFFSPATPLSMRDLGSVTGVEPVPHTVGCGVLSLLAFLGAFQVAQLVKNLRAMQETPVRFLEIGYPLEYSWASLVAQTVKNLPAMWQTWV